MRRRHRIAAAAAFILLPGAAAGCRPDAPRPDHVLLISIDTLRSDRLGCLGGEIDLTPHLDRLAAEGVLLTQVVTPVPRTSQAVASLLTGLHPIHHGVRGLFDALPPGAGTTLAQVFTSEGYETAALTSNLVLRPGQGFERGFGLYDNPRSRWVENGAAATVEDALDWIDRRKDADPRGWFLWLHLLDPHWPYRPSPPFDAAAGGVLDSDRALFDAGDGESGDGAHASLVFDPGLDESRVEHLRRLYDGEVAATDAAIGRLVEGLRQRGLLDRLLLVVTADHGESLGEHGYWFAHGEYLYDETLLVPAILRAPGRIPAGSRLTRPVRLYDLMPTILDLSGIRPPDALDGVSLAGEVRRATSAKAAQSAEPGDSGGRGEADPRDREIYLESDRDLLRPGNPRRFLPGYAGSWRGMRDGRWKWIRIPRGGDDLFELYDLKADPGERHDLSEAPPPDAAALSARLAEWEKIAAEAETRREQATPPEGTVDPDHLRMLRSLGYVAGNGR